MWHHGFRLSVDELREHPDYRGAQYIELGISLAQDEYLDPKMLGDASGTGTYDDQALKRLWHYRALRLTCGRLSRIKQAGNSSRFRPI